MYYHAATALILIGLASCLIALEIANPSRGIARAGLFSLAALLLFLGIGHAARWSDTRRKRRDRQ